MSMVMRGRDKNDGLARSASCPRKENWLAIHMHMLRSSDWLMAVIISGFSKESTAECCYNADCLSLSVLLRFMIPRLRRHLQTPHYSSHYKTPSTSTYRPPTFPQSHQDRVHQTAGDPTSTFRYCRSDRVLDLDLVVGARRPPTGTSTKDQTASYAHLHSHDSAESP